MSSGDQPSSSGTGGKVVYYGPKPTIKPGYQPVEPDDFTVTPLDREFLEKYPLHRPFPFRSPLLVSDMEKVFRPIRRECGRCGIEQTFQYAGIQPAPCSMKLELDDGRSAYRVLEDISGAHSPQASPRGSVITVWYMCSACSKFVHSYLLLVAPDGRSIKKMGQNPPWSIDVEPSVRKALGDHLDTYRKGLVCESQGYGIGAFAYYRRIVEEIIGLLLDDVAELIGEDAEREKYTKQLQTVREDYRAEVKIGVVKDLVPAVLRTSGTNPLAVLHSVLSDGIHSRDDAECLDRAAMIRESMVFLIDEVARSKANRAAYSANMEAIKKRLAKFDKTKSGES
jgi:hypothetical protein